MDTYQPLEQQSGILQEHEKWFYNKKYPMYYFNQFVGRHVGSFKSNISTLVLIMSVIASFDDLKVTSKFGFHVNG